MNDRAVTQPLLVFRWGERRWAIPSALVEEVTTFSAPTPPPVACGLSGVLPQRGELMGVLDPALLGEGGGTATRLLVCRSLDGLLGIPTSAIEGVFTRESGAELEEDIGVLDLSELIDRLKQRC